MSEAPERTQARRERSRWPGWIWAVPFVAAILVGWLTLRHFVNEGPKITVTFADSQGLQAGSSKVKYRNVDVGEVEDVKLAKDLSHTIVTLRMDSSVRGALTEGTRFWIVGPAGSLHDPSALSTIVSGPYIEMDPGRGKPATRFAGIEAPAPVAADARGTRFSLHAATLGSLAPGASVRYLGIDVGTVESTRLDGDKTGFDIGIFLRAPYDGLVHRTTRFWNAGGIAISTANGIDVRLTSLSALVSGAIAFVNPLGMTGPPARAGERFDLYDSQDDAVGAQTGQGVSYRVSFAGSVGDLKIGAPVRLRGFRIGSVTGVGFDYDLGTDRIETPVTIEIEPARLAFAGIPPSGTVNWRDLVDRALDHMIGEGLRAGLDHSPPIVGSAFVSLEFMPGQPKAGLLPGEPYPEIPATDAGGIGGMANQAHDLMAKVDAVPFAAIGDELRDALKGVAGVANAPQLMASIDHLDHSLANMEQVTRQLRGQSGPVLASVRKAADDAQAAADLANAVLGGGPAAQNGDLPQALRELTDAARSIRSLANYLDRHPEALVAGRPSP